MNLYFYYFVKFFIFFVIIVYFNEPKSLNKNLKITKHWYIEDCGIDENGEPACYFVNRKKHVLVEVEIFSAKVTDKQAAGRFSLTFFCLYKCLSSKNTVMNLNSMETKYDIISGNEDNERRAD